MNKDIKLAVQLLAGSLSQIARQPAPVTTMDDLERIWGYCPRKRAADVLSNETVKALVRESEKEPDSKTPEQKLSEFCERSLKTIRIFAFSLNDSPISFVMQKCRVIGAVDGFIIALDVTSTEASNIYAHFQMEAEKIVVER